MEKPTDEELMKLLQHGDTGALDELYGRYAERLLAFFSSVHRRPSRHEYEDLVQDVFLKILKSANTFNPRKAAFRTWFFAIARNHCIDIARREELVKTVPIVSRVDREGREASAVVEDDIEDPGGDPEASAIRSSVVDAVQDCIDQLESDDEREAIALYYLGGNVLREIGAILGKSTSSAKNLVDSAKEKVKQCLERRGIGPVP